MTLSRGIEIVDNPNIGNKPSRKSNSVRSYFYDLTSIYPTQEVHQNCDGATPYVPHLGAAFLHLMQPRETTMDGHKGAPASGSHAMYVSLLMSLPRKANATIRPDRMRDLRRSVFPLCFYFAFLGLMRGNVAPFSGRDLRVSHRILQLRSSDKCL